MAARYTTIGQFPDVRIELRGKLSEILTAPTPNPGTYAAPEDVTGTFLEMGADGLWTGASVGTLTQVEADALVASGAMASVKVGTPGNVAGTLVRYGGAGVGWVAATALTPYLPDVKKAAILSESILGAGNFPAKLLTAMGAGGSVDQWIYGGSHIGAALSAFAEKQYLPMRGGNACAASCAWTYGQNGWTSASQTHSSQVPTFFEGQQWTLVSKLTSTATTGPQVGIGTCPADVTGLFISMEVYIPTAWTDALKHVAFILRNTTDSQNIGSQMVFENLKAGEIQRLCAFVPYATMAPFAGVAKNLQVQVQLNRNSTNTETSLGRAYMRGMQVSYTAPNGYENLVMTRNAAVAPDASASVKEVSRSFSRYDVAFVSFGRNEANDAAEPNAHISAYKALIRGAMGVSSCVVASNPPPKNDSGVWDIANDAYQIRYSKLFKDLTKKFSPAVNVHEEFKSLDPAIVMSDSWHQSEAGSDVLVSKLLSCAKAAAIQNCQGIPDFKPAKMYWAGVVGSGSWAKVDAPVFRSLAGDKSLSSEIAYTTTTANSTLTFDVSGSVIYVVMRRLATGGSIDVTVDAGMAEERVTTLSTVLPQGAYGALQAFANLRDGSHTVTIKAKTVDPVTVYGVVAI